MKYGLFGWLYGVCNKLIENCFYFFSKNFTAMSVFYSITFGASVLIFQYKMSILQENHLNLVNSGKLLEMNTYIMNSWDIKDRYIGTKANNCIDFRSISLDKNNVMNFDELYNYINEIKHNDNIKYLCEIDWEKWKKFKEQHEILLKEYNPKSLNKTCVINKELDNEYIKLKSKNWEKFGPLIWLSLIASDFGLVNIIMGMKN